MTAWRSKRVVFYDYSVIYYLITLYIVALTSFIRYIRWNKLPFLNCQQRVGGGGAGGDGRKTTVAASHSFLQQYKAYNINLGKCINNSYS
jgi:hypothetical protein